MAGSVVSSPDRNSYSQSNVHSVENDFLVNNNSSSIDKDKTPMCLVNELARFNKVTLITILQKFIYMFMCLLSSNNNKTHLYIYY